MQTNTWKTLMWQDMNLVWNPDDYGGLKTVCLPADSIWTPVNIQKLRLLRRSSLFRMLF